MEIRTVFEIRRIDPTHWMFISILALLILSTSGTYAATEKILTIYLSADRTGAKLSGNSIEQGIRTALDEINYKIGDYNIKLKSLDHRGSTPRAKKHLQTYLNDPTAIALFAGLHSPPLLATRDYINENKILVLVPWAAAAPITRYPSTENWIFRLSVDDSKAGDVIATRAVDQAGFKNIALLLEETGWGKTNKRTMTLALKNRGLTVDTVKWFNWGLSENNARILLREVNQSGADAIFMVSNVNEGLAFAKAMASLPVGERLPIFSHWGITGGNFAEQTGAELRNKLKLNFIQTSFSFLNPLTKFQQSVLERAKDLYPATISSPEDIKAPSGFIHGYDLTRIFIAAANQNLFGENNLVNRNNLRLALESVNKPVQGLIKTYNKPFSIFSESNPDAHEALGTKDLTMGHYGPKNEIILD